MRIARLKRQYRRCLRIIERLPISERWKQVLRRRLRLRLADLIGEQLQWAQKKKSEN